MADLIIEQRETARRISRVIINMKKKGAASITEGFISVLQTHLKELWMEFHNRHASIRKASLKDPKLQNDPYFTEDYYDEVEQSYVDQASGLEDYGRKLQQEKSVPQNSNEATVDAKDARSRTVLPRIPLPTFDGRYSEWTTFRDLFTSLVRKDITLSNVERLHYLKSCVTNDAAALLRNLTITEDNFDRAWEILTNRFENRRLLINQQLSTLMTLPAVTRESATELKRLVYGTCDVVGALNELKRPITNATDWLVYLTVEKLDRQSRREWETSLGSKTEPPSFEELQKFLEGRIRTVEALEVTKPEVRQEPKRAARVHQVSQKEPEKKCDLCSGSHYLMFCATYQGKRPAERRSIVRSLNRCINCLGKHALSECTSTKRCRKCADTHHTTLHDSFQAPAAPSVQHAAMATQQPTSVILGTARVKVMTPGGLPLTTRALIDPGSEVSLISESLVQRLGLKRQRATVPLLGVGGTRTRTTKGRTSVTILPLGESCPFQVSVLILPELSCYRPRNLPLRTTWPHLRDLSLADPRYQFADPVDILLGADCYNLILRNGVRRGDSNAPVAQNTSLGWILTGGIRGSEIIGDSAGPGRRVHHCAVDRELVTMLTRFWEQEEVSVDIPSTPEDLQCEQHFVSTHRRAADGRFVVRLPFRTSPELGNSRLAATRTLESMKRRFQRSGTFAEAYRDFMLEYERLGHMQRVRSQGTIPGYYLPHHGVFKESSTTTKLRVVFNGSMPTDTGKSLNDCLHSGPNLLPSLSDVLLRWRQHAVVFTADAEKMYRQILVHPDDRRWQRILWTADHQGHPREYELCTVTYGLSCAPYLAIRCLHQLADEGTSHFPRGAAVLKSDVYVDDVLSGAATIEDAMQTRRELDELLMAGGFRLRKWASNSSHLLEGLQVDRQATVSWTPSQDQHCVLGLHWASAADSFRVTVFSDSSAAGNTKRAILSKIAKIFDPLGWLSPVIVKAKILMQGLWLLRTGWDTPLPEREEQEWKHFLHHLPALNCLQLPRWLRLAPSNRSVEVHCFSDASERAYAAVLYLRVIDENGDSHTTLVTAKSKVAPLQRVSIPRLELSAACLAVKLVAHTVTVLSLTAADVYMWVDCSVALAWIQGHPSRWKTYVANRVTTIQQTLPHAVWHHIKGQENPADCASRGLSPKDLPAFNLWWKGPSWLDAPQVWPRSREESITTSEEERTTTIHTLVTEEDEVSTYIKRFSSLSRLLRVTAWCCRWRRKRANQAPRAYLDAAEINEAKRRLVRVVQAKHFPVELQCLQSDRAIPPSSRLLKLTPLLDTDGLLRVGGRLRNAPIHYAQRHALILPNHSPLTALWVNAAHRRCLYGGVQLTLATLRQECWILRGRLMVKACLQQCVTCVRWRARASHQLMGDLPQARVTPSRPFVTVGIDYAGPILLRTSRGRTVSSSKGYIALFVCLCTKAVHLEVVSDGSSETFLAALRRFIARRGLCRQIFSDCGTAFVGANRELRDLLRTVDASNHDLFASIAAQGIEWRFNPPAAPHFGGLWEAGVKSVKHHLRRQIGDTRLTFEELSTLLCSIEACLNSRPLEPLSDDPEDLEPLTPGHFLIGGPLLTFPEPNIEHLPIPRLSRWQFVQQLQQQFWRRWSREYLNTLQTRNKWSHVHPAIRVGALCLLKSEIQSPTKWPLARVVEIHPGDDGHTRVVTVRTAASTFRRPITKIVLLPREAADASPIATTKDRSR